MPPLRHTRREAFCLATVSGLNGTQAAKAAGFAPSHLTTYASYLLTRPDIKTRIAELQEALEVPTIMSLKERKERLSTLGRNTKQDDVADPIRAITELNKMEKVYEVGGGVPPVAIQAVQINIVLASGEKKTLAEYVKGFQPEKEVADGNMGP